MTKVFITNDNMDHDVSVRIYPLTSESAITAPPSLTPMDSLGISVGVKLQPAPILCVGSTTYAGGFTLNGAPNMDGYSVTPDGKRPVLADSPFSVVNAMQDAGYRVTHLTAWIPTVNG